MVCPSSSRLKRPEGQPLTRGRSKRGADVDSSPIAVKRGGGYHVVESIDFAGHQARNDLIEDIPFTLGQGLGQLGLEFHLQALLSRGLLLSGNLRELPSAPRNHFLECLLLALRKPAGIFEILEAHMQEVLEVHRTRDLHLRPAC
eukprot:m.597393 g.597393  ORF g.597393 m.597393 type:complete len:145 (+) comp58068_c0_seq1:5478-5912(+)